MSAEKPRPITEFVPPILRTEMQHPEMLIQLLPGDLAHLSLDRRVHYIEDAIAHQALIGKDSGNPVFRAHIVSVDTDDRKSGPKLLGRKGIIHFRAKDMNGDTTDQSIQTGWIEYYGYNPEQVTWEIALANTIKEIAEDNIGKDVFIQKYVFESGDSYKKTRMAIGINPEYKSEDNESDEPRKSQSSKNNKPAKKVDHRNKVLSLLDEMDQDESITEEDVDELVRIFQSKRDISDNDIWYALAEYFEVKPDKLVHPKAEDNDQLTWAIQVMLENI